MAIPSERSVSTVVISEKGCSEIVPCSHENRMTSHLQVLQTRYAVELRMYPCNLPLLVRPGYRGARAVDFQVNSRVFHPVRRLVGVLKQSTCSEVAAKQ